MLLQNIHRFYSSFFSSTLLNAKLKELLKSDHMCQTKVIYKSGTFL